MSETILVIASSAPLIQGIQDILGSSYTIDVAKSKEQAFQILQRGGLPIMCIIDEKVSGRDGFEVCGGLRTIADTDSIGLLYLTSTPDNYDKIRANQIGIDDLMGKPIPESKFIEKVENLVKKYQLGAEVLAKAREATGVQSRPGLDNPFHGGSDSSTDLQSMIYHGYDDNDPGEVPGTHEPAVPSTQPPPQEFHQWERTSAPSQSESWNAQSDSSVDLWGQAATDAPTNWGPPANQKPQTEYQARSNEYNERPTGYQNRPATRRQERPTNHGEPKTGWGRPSVAVSPLDMPTDEAPTRVLNRGYRQKKQEQEYADPVSFFMESEDEPTTGFMMTSDAIQKAKSRRAKKPVNGERKEASGGGNGHGSGKAFETLDEAQVQRLALTEVTKKLDFLSQEKIESIVNRIVETKVTAIMNQLTPKIKEMVLLATKEHVINTLQKKKDA